MGKRLIFILLALTLSFSGASCSERLRIETEDLPTVTMTETGDIQIATKNTLHPMSEIPDYTLPAGATTDQIRAMVVKAMRDELSIQWVCDETWTFEKVDSTMNKSFTVYKGTVYAGMPYALGNTGLLSWMQYYDLQTGHMSESIDYLSKKMGNACLSAIKWAWATVLSDVSWHNNWELVPAIGVIPVAPCRVDPGLRDWNHFDTITVCEENGVDVMYRSYAAALPADMIGAIGNGVGHFMMLAENPHVEYNADGSIDGENSYLTILDQYPSYKKEMRDGEAVTAFGRMGVKFTFAELFLQKKIVFTTEELTGEKPYEGLKYSFLTGDGNAVSSFDDFGSAAIKSTHYVITVTATVTDKNGDEVGSIKRISTTERFSTPNALTYAASGLPRASAFKGLQKGESYTYHLSALMATGATVDLGEFDFIY